MNVGVWVLFLLSIGVYLGVITPHGPLPTPPAKPAVVSECQAAKADKAAGGAMDPALYCK